MSFNYHGLYFDLQIKNLRKHLKEAGATVELKAVYGIGYKLVEE